ncbi:MAG: putative quinol monooxygenase [Pontiella sp.]
MIHVLASIKIKPGHRDALIQRFKKNIPLVRAEDGCIQYELTVDADSGIEIQEKNENIVTVVEKWKSVEALHAHLAAPHMKQYNKDTEDMVDGLDLKVLEEA